MALQVRATLGLDPWDVFHQGVSEHDRAVVRHGRDHHQRRRSCWPGSRCARSPGIGTVSNVFVVGLAVGRRRSSLIPEGGPLGVRLAMLAAGVVLNAVAGAAYLGAGLGPGARDGLMTGFVRRTGARVGKVRTSSS